MQLSDILQTSQIAAMRGAATHVSYADTYAPKIHTKAREYVCQHVTEYTKRGFSAAFWRDLQDAILSDGAAIVYIENKCAKVLRIQRNRIFARHLGEEVKAGKRMFWVEKHFGYELDKAEWKATWAELTATPERNNYPVPVSQREAKRIQINAERDAMFYGMAQTTRYKKIGKRGFNTSFDEMRAQMRTEAYERQLRNITKGAREIYASL